MTGLPVAGGASDAGIERKIADRRPGPVASNFEFWPSRIFRAPLVLQWIALGLWYGDMSLPTAANPLIETGGLCGESKAAILDQAAPPLRDVIAPYTIIARPDFALAEAAMARAALGFPIIVKPDIGQNGAGVRLAADAGALAAVLPLYPRDARLMLQRFIADEGEAGLFYIRQPGEATGRITSVTLKQAPFVVGDGSSTIEALIHRDPRAALVPHLYLPRLGARRHEVPRAGERVRLVLVGNHCRGAIFFDGADVVTPALTARLDELARALPEFHFGRFDVRFDTLPALRRGEGFTVIEVNGVGAEPTHVWDARTRLMRAWKDQFAHISHAFAIGAANRARGFRPSGLGPMLQAWRRQQRLLSLYPQSD